MGVPSLFPLLFPLLVNPLEGVTVFRMPGKIAFADSFEAIWAMTDFGLPVLTAMTLQSRFIREPSAADIAF